MRGGATRTRLHHTVPKILEASDFIPQRNSEFNLIIRLAISNGNNNRNGNSNGKGNNDKYGNNSNHSTNSRNSNNGNHNK